MFQKALVRCVLFLTVFLLPTSAPAEEVDPAMVSEIRSMVDTLYEKRDALEPKDLTLIERFQYSMQDPEFYALMDKDGLVKLEQLNHALQYEKSQFSAEERRKYEKAVDFHLSYAEKRELDEMTDEDVAKLDSRLQHDWEAMCSALKRGDIETAAGYFHKETREAYRRNFKALAQERLAEIATEMETIRFVKHRSFEMIYALRKMRDGQEYSFQLTFTKEIRGDWKIYNF
jgi:hypothetical protein